MASFQFLHCADLHIDSPLRGLESDPDAPVDRIRRATREAFTNLVDFAIEHGVAFVLAAGDLYDGDWQDWRTGRFLVDQVRRLGEAGIPFLTIAGNHDADSVITRRLTLPAPAFTFPSRAPGTWRSEALGVCVHGQGFATRAMMDNLVPGYPPPVPGMLNIGMLHTDIDGSYGDHARYAPCTLEQLRNRGYDYWALGHIHTPQRWETPWIVFPGNIQGRHAGETGAKGATLVTVRDSTIVNAAPLYFDTVRWAHLIVDLTAAGDEDAAFALIRAALTQARADAEGRLLAARVTLAGATPAHAALNRDPGNTRERVRAEALALAGADAIWIEKVSLDIRVPVDAGAMLSPLLAEIDRLDPAELAPEAAEWCRTMLDRAGGLREDLKLLDKDHPLLQMITDGVIPKAMEDQARNLLRARLAGDT